MWESAAVCSHSKRGSKLRHTSYTDSKLVAYLQHCYTIVRHFVCCMNTIKKLHLCKKRTVAKRPQGAWYWYWWGKNLVWLRGDQQTIFVSNLIGSWLVNAYLCCVHFILRNSFKKGTGIYFLRIRGLSQLFGYRISHAGRGRREMLGVVWASLSALTLKLILKSMRKLDV